MFKKCRWSNSTRIQLKSTALTTNCLFFLLFSHYSDFKFDAYLITFNQFTVESIRNLHFFGKIASNPGSSVVEVCCKYKQIVKANINILLYILLQI